MKLSEHFTLEEMTRSDKATKYHISNYPSAEHLNNLKILTQECLECVRTLFNNKPIIISSGYRSIALNKILKGSNTSHHCKGMACDFIIKGLTVEEIVKKIKNSKTIKYTQLIEEYKGATSWVHIAYDKNNLKRENLLYKNGKYSKI